MHLPKAWPKAFLLLGEALILIILMWFLTPALPGFSFAISVKEDQIEDFRDGSFEATALIDTGSMQGVRLLPMGLAGKWITDAQPLPLKLNNLSAIAWTGKIFLAGGDDEKGNRRREVYSTTIYQDGSLQPWVTLPKSSWLPDQGIQDGCRYDNPSGADPDGCDGLSSGALAVYPHSETTATLYYVGGIKDDNTYSSKVYYATITATTGSVGPWLEAQGPDYGMGRIYLSAIAIDDYLFVIAGNLGTGSADASPTNSVCKARINSDGSLGGWECNPDEELPVPLNSSSAIFFTGNLSRTIYLIGGYDGSTGRQEVWFADVITSTGTPTPTLTGWLTSTGGSMPTALYAHSAVEVRGEIFATGGEAKTGEVASNTVQLALVDETEASSRLYNWGPSIGAWIGGPILPQPRSRHATVSWNGNIYVIGGNDENQYKKDTVYRGSVDGQQEGEPFYPPKGLYTSNPLELDPGSQIRNLRWKVSLPQDTGLRLQYRYGQSLKDLLGASWSGWVASVSGTNYITFTPPLSPATYFQYQIELTRGSVVTFTPIFDWIEIFYDVPDPSISVSKDTYLGVASPGDILDYRINYSNPGGIDLPQAIVTEELPQWTRFVGFGWNEASGNLYTKTVIVRGRGLLGGTRFRIQVDENIPPYEDYITNTVWIAHPPITDALGNIYTFPPVSATYTLRITGVRSLFKEAWPTSRSRVYWGQPITYTITFSNQYGTDFSTLVISDVIGTALYDVTPLDGGIFSNGVITWTLSNIAAGEGATVRFTARVTPGLQAGFTITNRAYSEAYVPGEPEPVLAQESNEVRHYVKGARLDISKASHPPSGSSVKWGELITYSITVTNTGYYTAQNLIITDVVDAEALEVINSGGGNYQNGAVTWEPGALGPGESIMMKLVARVRSGLPQGQVIVNSASATATSSDVFASSQVTHTVAGPPGLAVFKNATPAPGTVIQYGELITYRLTYQNGGDSPAFNVVITDPLDTSVLSYVSGGTYQDGLIRWELDYLAPGASGEVSFTARINEGVPAGVITNTAFIGGEALGTLASTPITHRIAGPPVLFISKSAIPASGTPVMPEDLITYTLLYTNTGGDAHNIVVTEEVPEHAQVMSTGGATLSGNTLRWEGLKLPMGATAEVSFTVQVNPFLPRCGDYTILNPVTGYNIEARETYNTIPGQVLGEPVAHPVQFPPDLTVAVDDGKTKIANGDTLLYTISYSNVCGIEMNDVALTLTLGSGLVAGDNPDWNPVEANTYVKDVGSLQGGEGSRVYFNATVSGLAPESSTGVTVTIGGRGEEEWDPHNNTATDWDISGGADFFIKEITVSPSSIEPGGSVEVQVTVINQGDATPQGGYGGEWVALALYLKQHPSEPPEGPADWTDFAEGLCPSEYEGNCYTWISLLDLEPGEEWTKSFVLNVGNTEGVYDLYAQVDVWAGTWGGGGSAEWGYVQESCETNNIASWRGLYVVSGQEGRHQIFLPLVMKQK